MPEVENFTGSEDHAISLTDAATMTARYRATISNGDTIAHYFGKDAIQEILDQGDCVGIRIYYGLDDQDAKHLIITGVTEDREDLYNGLLAERSKPCPDSCSSANPLNSNE
jgi:hypothetical protein